MSPPCDRYVPGFGDSTADFHLVGDNPGTHGGLSTGIPFTERSWSGRFFGALARAGLVSDVDLDAGRVVTDRAFLSYLSMCDPGPDAPSEADYREMESYIDAEIRAITAHVLLPVGQRATEYVLSNYTARPPEIATDMTGIHASELRGSGWLVVPIRDPSGWQDGDITALVDRLETILETDYRQLSDLGRFIPGGDSYIVR